MQEAMVESLVDGSTRLSSSRRSARVAEVPPTALSGSRSLALGFGEEGKVVDQALFHFFAGDDGIDHAVFEEEFGGLEAGGKFRLSGVFDDARSCKTDHG